MFFGLGGYAMAMYLKLEAAHGGLPDFMSWSGLSALPAFWRPFSDPVFALAAAILLPAALAALVAYLLSRSGVGGVYFAIITQALAFIASTLFIGQQAFTGGTNGLTNFEHMFGAPLRDPGVQTRLYQLTVLALLATCALTFALTRTRFGRLLVAMRDDEQRVRCLGYNPTALKVIVFALAAGLAGLAGALYVPQVGIVNPDALGIITSIQVVVWVAVGGRGTLFGPVAGAVLVNAAQSAVSESFPSLWQYLIGALFVATVLIFPRGLAGAGSLVPGAWRRLRRVRLRPAASAAGPSVSLKGAPNHE